MSDKDKERQSFEAWVMKTRKPGTHITRSHNGVYLDNRVAAKWTAFQAGRASLAASAGSEPVAWFVEEHSDIQDLEWNRIKPTYPGNWKPLYTHPSPPEGMVGGWISVDARLPQPGMPVLLDIGRKFPIRAMWAPAKTLEASGDSDVVGDYDEAKDIYYCPEGWYEWNQFEETHWFVTETPRAWQALPITAPPIAAGGGKEADHG